MTCHVPLQQGPEIGDNYAATSPEKIGLSSVPWPKHGAYVIPPPLKVPYDGG